MRCAASPRLVIPTAAVADSFRAAVAEFRVEGRFGPTDDSELADSLEQALGIADARGFAAYLRLLRARDAEDTPGRVPSTMLWYVDGVEFLGRVSVRHRLTPSLRQRGGHIGYDVRPSARRRGHATAMLRDALPVAARLGIERALLTCDATNAASRKVIESAGGVPEPGEGPMLRYWVPTA